MTTPTCPYCERPYADPRGCAYHPEDARPKVYGSELYPLSHGDTCRDCGAPKGTPHHAGCACTECPICHDQWHGNDMSCEKNRSLTMGGVRQ